MRIVIALGGNALIPRGEEGTVEQQRVHIGETAKHIKKLVEKNEVVITHGNGPQVGDLLLKQEDMPLDVLVAETQGQIGYLLEQTFENIFHKPTVVVSTQVVVDKNDSAFKRPTKPVGSFYKTKQPGMVMDSGRGYRKVVASPMPLAINEIEQIKTLLKDTVVIAAGGGGTPVIEENGKLKGVEAVIDKDRTSQLLANLIKADTLMILIEEDYAYLNFGKENQKGIEFLSINEAKQLMKEKQFTEGNMLPKIESCVKFIENGGKKAIIGSIKNAEKEIGTVIM